MICCGPAKLDRKIARDAADTIEIEGHRTLGAGARETSRGRIPARWSGANEQLAGLAPLSIRAADGAGDRQRAHGADRRYSEMLDDVVEIPVWGLPFSYNVATATAMCLYEYCRQFPEG